MRLAGLADADARALLASVLPQWADQKVIDRIVAEAGGNPLALLELPRGMTPAELAGGPGFGGTAGLPGRIEESFGRRLELLPEPTRRLVLLAAADSAGDAALLWRACALAGIDPGAAGPAQDAGLVQVGARIRFFHPLVRSAVFRAASAQERRAAHGVLAAATDVAADPGRRAWHRAQAAPGPDEQVAGELEDSAEQAQARGGVAAAAAFLERAAALTLDPQRRSAGRRYPAGGGMIQALAELVEAAVRCHQPEAAQTALQALCTYTRPGRADWGLGLEARSRALLADGGAAQELYTEAIARLGRTRMRLPLARAHLLYGEWLRRERRRTDARAQLRTAYHLFEAMGARSFAGRARQELTATGGTVHSRRNATLDELTPQEARIASLAGEGLSNPEIAARLYISKGTVDYHLNKVFRKLGIRSRAQLHRALAPVPAHS